MTRLLAEAARNVTEALKRLESQGELGHYIIEINRLRNDGDRVAREAIASLFRRPHAPERAT